MAKALAALWLLSPPVVHQHPSPSPQPIRTSWPSENDAVTSGKVVFERFLNQQFRCSLASHLSYDIHKRLDHSRGRIASPRQRYIGQWHLVVLYRPVDDPFPSHRTHRFWNERQSHPSRDQADNGQHLRRARKTVRGTSRTPAKGHDIILDPRFQVNRNHHHVLVGQSTQRDAPLRGQRMGGG